MARSRPFSNANPDLRRRPQFPSPPIEDVERQLQQWLSPATFKPKVGERNTDGKRLRNRILTLPVMVAVVLSLVYRQINGLSELLRVLQLEGLLWVEPMVVSHAALDKRFRKLPVALFSQLLTQVQAQVAERPSGTVLSDSWQALQGRFSAIWIADGSTLEELRRQLKALREKPQTVLAGKLMMVVELFSHRPVAMHYDKNAKANDKTFGDWLLSTLPGGVCKVVCVKSGIATEETCLQTQSRNDLRHFSNRVCKVVCVKSGIATGETCLQTQSRNDLRHFSNLESALSIFSRC